MEVVRVTSESIIRPASVAASSLRNNTVKLSYFDSQFFSPMPTRRLLFYKTEDYSLFPSHVASLKRSLCEALLHYPTLAGKVVHSADLDELEIDCADPGVAFTEADTSVLDFDTMAGDETQELEPYEALAPHVDMSKLPAPVLCVRVTGFSGSGGGGLVVGLTVNHVAVDGCALWEFVRSWAETASRGKLRPSPDVSVDRSPLRQPADVDVSRSILRQRQRLPRDGRMASTWKKKLAPATTQKTFVVSRANLRSLKLKAEKYGMEVHPVSSFVALTAHAWASSIQARNLKDEDEPCCLFFPMDCRPHVDLPSSQIFFGNCVRMCKVKAKASELKGEEGFVSAIRALQRVIRETREDPLKDREEWPALSRDLPDSFVWVASSPKFEVYKTDFGWGKPSRVELVPFRVEGSVVYVAAREEEEEEKGGIQVTISHSPPIMDEFSSLFLKGLI